jgi:hypothetical protein
MADEPKPVAQRSYEIGNLAAGARVAQGENISWVEGAASLPDRESLTRQFDALLKRISADTSLDEDTRALAQEKTKAIAEGIAKVQESPTALRRALLDAKSWFGVTASWVGGALGDHPEERAGAEDPAYGDGGSYEGSDHLPSDPDRVGLETG